MSNQGILRFRDSLWRTEGNVENWHPDRQQPGIDLRCDASTCILLYRTKGWVPQTLRNLISNALEFHSPRLRFALQPNWRGRDSSPFRLRIQG